MSNCYALNVRNNTSSPPRCYEYKNETKATVFEIKTHKNTAVFQFFYMKILDYVFSKQHFQSHFFCTHDTEYNHHSGQWKKKVSITCLYGLENMKHPIKHMKQDRQLARLFVISFFQIIQLSFCGSKISPFLQPQKLTQYMQI